jgi:hypothetical protein
MFNEILLRFRQPNIMSDLHSIRFINGLANFHVQTRAKSRRSQQKSYIMPLVENFFSLMTS